MTSKTKQYRPSFTAAQITNLLTLLSSNLSNPISANTHKYLSRFARDITEGYKNPAFTSTQRKSIEESLGMGTNTNDTSIRRELACIKYLSSPEFCTKEELEDAYNHTLANPSLLTQEQFSELEAKVFS